MNYFSVSSLKNIFSVRSDMSICGFYLRANQLCLGLRMGGYGCYIHGTKNVGIWLLRKRAEVVGNSSFHTASQSQVLLHWH